MFSRRFFQMGGLSSDAVRPPFPLNQTGIVGVHSRHNVQPDLARTTGSLSCSALARSRRALAMGLALGALMLLLVACSRTPEASRRVVAVLPASYLGADASSRWLSNAVTAAIAEQVRGISAASVFLVRDANEAANRGATEILRTSVSGDATRPRLHLYLDRPASRQVRLLLQDSAASPAELLVQLRKGLEAGGLAGNPFSTENGDAFVRFGMALVADNAAQSEQALREALAADPRFTGAALRLASALAATGNRSGAEAELEGLLSRLPEDRAVERAYARLELAGLRLDREGVLQALEQTVSAVPQDADARLQLAQAFVQSRRYSDAAKHFVQLAHADPSNAQHWNQAVYAHAFAGDRERALALMEDYRRAAPQDANVEDSAGDVHFFFSQFRQAAERYTAAYDRNPKLLNGFSLFKAGWAWLYAGELAQADEAVARYTGALRESNPALADFRSAQWQFLRGRRQEARSAAEAMRRQEGQYGPGFASLLASQLYLWDVAEQGVSALEFRRGARYGLSVRPVVAALAQASQPGLTAAQRAAMISQVGPAEQQPLLVAVATYLDATRGQGMPEGMLDTFRIADGAVAESRAMVTHLLLAWALASTGNAEEAMTLFQRRLPPVAEDDGLLWALVMPQSLLWERDTAAKAGASSSIEKLDALVRVLLPGSGN